MWETFGQILGFVGVFFSIITYQMPTRKGALATLTTSAAVFCVHYLLVGGVSGLILNGIVIVRNFFFNFREKRWFMPRLFPVIFSVAMVGFGIVFWEGFYTLFIMLGLIVNTVGVSFSKVQLLRKSTLLSAPLTFTYNVFVPSYAGMLKEGLVFFSALFSVMRHARKEKQNFFPRITIRVLRGQSHREAAGAP